jgi:hypothetical protein
VNIFDMPSPGPITSSQSLVQQAYRAIQYTRVVAERQPDSDSGEQLRKFFLQCAKFCPKPLTAEQIKSRAEAQALAATATNTAGGRGSN